MIVNGGTTKGVAGVEIVAADLQLPRVPGLHRTFLAQDGENRTSEYDGCSSISTRSPARYGAVSPKTRAAHFVDVRPSTGGQRGETSVARNNRARNKRACDGKHEGQNIELARAVIPVAPARRRAWCRGSIKRRLKDAACVNARRSSLMRASVCAMAAA